MLSHVAVRVSCVLLLVNVSVVSGAEDKTEFGVLTVKCVKSEVIVTSKVLVPYDAVVTVYVSVPL